MIPCQPYDDGSSLDDGQTSSQVKMLTPQRWSQILGPYLENAMIQHGEYTPGEIYGHMELFTELVGPWLYPGPEIERAGRNIVYKPKYPSAMTIDFTPLELSYCWRNKNQQGKPIIRFIVDMAPSFPEQSRASSLARAVEAIQAMKAFVSARDAQASTLCQLIIFPDLWIHITREIMRHEWEMHGEGCTACGPSSTFVGFDLERAVAKTKLYWRLPSCQPNPGLLDMLDQVFQSCCVVDSFFGSSGFVDAWNSIEHHVTSNPDTLRPRMLSVDATKHPSPRLKVYIQCLFRESTAFDTIESHLTLGGRLEPSSDFVSTCRNVWTSLTTDLKGEHMPQPGVAGPRYCLILYEISSAPSSAAPASGIVDGLSSKLYIMGQEIPRRDSFIAQKLLDHCPLINCSPLMTWVHCALSTAILTDSRLYSASLQHCKPLLLSFQSKCL
jgi:DMATS type aromatic prenyltransferase